jgi:hypothetical protein
MVERRVFCSFISHISGAKRQNSIFCPIGTHFFLSTVLHQRDTDLRTFLIACLEQTARFSQKRCSINEDNISLPGRRSSL